MRIAIPIGIAVLLLALLMWFGGVSPLDALLLINRLNAGEVEPEAPAAAPRSSAAALASMASAFAVRHSSILG